MSDFYKKINIVAALLLLLWSGQMVGQDGANPFELQHRADRRAQSSLDLEVSDSSEVVGEEMRVQNPFDIIRVAPKNEALKSAISPKEKKPSEKVTKVVEDKNFRFWLTLCMLVFIALASSVYRSQLTKAYRAFANENVMRMLHREKGTVAYFPYYVLYALFIFNAGIYIYLLLRHYNQVAYIENLPLLGYLLGGITVLLLSKHMVVSFLGMVFPIQKETSLYNMTITIFGVVLSLVLFVFNILIAYAPTALTSIFIYFSFFILGSIYLFCSIRGLSIGSRFLNRNKFHFFIYLCSLEIAPVLILWKIISQGAGIQ
ncbi:MAG TPA: DUF4271 domain-containing protein [Phaeodactylibacter sp.]|nr:DUF4271 domain-containing protein [Phaeodactylibacter sp.]